MRKINILKESLEHGETKHFNFAEMFPLYQTNPLNEEIPIGRTKDRRGCNEFYCLMFFSVGDKHISYCYKILAHGDGLYIKSNLTLGKQRAIIEELFTSQLMESLL